MFQSHCGAETDDCLEMLKKCTLNVPIVLSNEKFNMSALHSAMNVSFFVEKPPNEAGFCTLVFSSMRKGGLSSSVEHVRFAFGKTRHVQRWRCHVIDVLS